MNKNQILNVSHMKNCNNCVLFLSYTWHLLCLFWSKSSRFHKKVWGEDDSHQPLQDLIQTQARPQSEVWSKEVERFGETERINRDPLHANPAVKVQPQPNPGLSVHDLGGGFLDNCGPGSQTGGQAVGDQNTGK